MNCPDCGHSVEEHELFCMHIYCTCNISKDAAEARSERDELKNKLEVAKEALEYYASCIRDDAGTRARKALEIISPQISTPN